MWTEKVVCPHCGMLTNKAPFCKFCGKPLDIESTQAPEESKPPELPLSESSTEASQPLQETAPAPEVSEERKIIEQLSNLYNWRNKLLDIFLKGESSPEVVMDVYREYREKIKLMNEKRLQKIRELEDKINELTSRLENLKIRHEVGEIPERQYITEKLNIDRELSRLKPKLTMLQNAFNIKLADIPEYESMIRGFRERFASEGESRGLSREDVELITSDLDEVLENLKGLIEQHKQLKKELEKIELRYKVGELTDEEYQSMKQKIERQLEM